MNLFRARLVRDAAGDRLELGSQTLALPQSILANKPALLERLGQEVIVGIRPENLDDATLHPAHPAGQRLKAPVVIAESLGSDQMVHFALDAPMAKVADRDRLDDIVVTDAKAICIGRFDARSRVRTGDMIEVAVSCDRLHFFDAATGRAI
jgi:multiple sugar transport system ATP-binding protein